MSDNAYELLALAMRYVFAALMLLIVLRAWRISIVDSRRASRLRRLSPDTGIIGEMLVVGGSERARPGMRYPLTLEGSIGSARGADIRVRHSSVRSRHAIFQMTNDGLYVRGHAHARIRDGHGRIARELTLRDGEILRLGDVALMLVLTEADNAPEEINRSILRKHARRPEAESTEYADSTDDMFDVPAPEEDDFDDLFMRNPASNFRSDTYDAFDDFDDA